MKKWIAVLIYMSSSSFLGAEQKPLTQLLDFEDVETETIPSSPTSEESSYILRVRFPSSLKVPALCGFYKGYRLNFSPDICVIKESSTCPSFCIIIAQDVSINSDDNTIQRLEQIPAKKYRMFYLAKNIAKDGAIAWNVEEEAPANIPQILPKSALILLFNPDYISKVASPAKTESRKAVEKTPQTSQDEVVYLPVIEIKKDISQQEVDAICKTSWCAAVEMRGVHRPTGVTKKNDTLRLISLTGSRSLQTP